MCRPAGKEPVALSPLPTAPGRPADARSGLRVGRRWMRAVVLLTVPWGPLSTGREWSEPHLSNVPASPRLAIARKCYRQRFEGAEAPRRGSATVPSRSSYCRATRCWRSSVRRSAMTVTGMLLAATARGLWLDEPDARTRRDADPGTDPDRRGDADAGPHPDAGPDPAADAPRGRARRPSGRLDGRGVGDERRRGAGDQAAIRRSGRRTRSSRSAPVRAR